MERAKLTELSGLGLQIQVVFSLFSCRDTPSQGVFLS